MTEDELIERMKNYRRAKARHTARNVLNTASLALGGRGLTARPDPEAEKAKLREPLIKQMHAAEQAQMEERGRMMREQIKQTNDNYRARLKAAVDRSRISQNAAEARARLHGERLENEIARLDERTENLGQLNSDQEAAVKAYLASDESAFGQLISRARQLQAIEAMRAGKEVTNPVDTVKEAKGYLRKDPGLQWLYERAIQEDLQQALSTGYAPDQALAVLQSMASTYGVDPGTMPGLKEPMQQLAQQVDQQRDEMDRQLLALGQQWEQMAGQTFGGSQDLQELMSVGRQARELTAQARRQASDRAAAQNDPNLQASDEELLESWSVQDTQSPSEQVAEQQKQQGEMVRAQTGSLTPAEQWQESMGIPFDGSAQEQTLKALQAIDSMDTSPAHLRLKKQMMDSQDFQQFMGNRGYKDPDFAFREFKREVMATSRRRKRDDRKARRENVKAGITAYSKGGRENRVPVVPQRNPTRGDTDTVVEE